MFRKSKYDPKKHHRKSIRLKGYDYSQPGLYFITICVQNFRCLFGEIRNGEMILNDAGQMVENEWLKIPERFTNTRLLEFVVMPNHFHAILEIIATPLGNVDRLKGQPQGIAPDIEKRKTLGDMVGAFQSIVTVKYIHGVKTLGWKPFDKKLFQRNYYERIIRNEHSLARIGRYIINNPKNWDADKFRE